MLYSLVIFIWNQIRIAKTLCRQYFVTCMNQEHREKETETQAQNETLIFNTSIYLHKNFNSAIMGLHTVTYLKSYGALQTVITESKH